MASPNHKGFSLIELLVAISIVAIISTMAVLIYSSVQKETRDKARLRDLNTIKQALELYKSNHNFYPSSLSFLVPTYFENIPQDPLSARWYAYQAFPLGCSQTMRNCSTFLICAKGETGRGANSCTHPQLATNLNCGSGGSCDIGIAPN